MSEKRLVQWYAADAGVDLDIAEREVALTYVLHVLREKGLLNHIAAWSGVLLCSSAGKRALRLTRIHSCPVCQWGIMTGPTCAAWCGAV